MFNGGVISYDNNMADLINYLSYYSNNEFTQYTLVCSKNELFILLCWLFLNICIVCSWFKT